MHALSQLHTVTHTAKKKKVPTSCMCGGFWWVSAFPFRNFVLFLLSLPTGMLECSGGLYVAPCFALNELNKLLFA